MAAKVSFSPTMSFQHVARAIDEAERRVRESVPHARLIYIEPDVLRVEPHTEPHPEE